MKQFGKYILTHYRSIGWIVLATLLISWLLTYKLGSLTGGIGPTEYATGTQPVGWHGLFHDPFYLPLKLARSAIFALFIDHGQTLTRLPNIFFGALTIINFLCLMRLWHGVRTTVLAGFLFATSAWVLHVSRLASFDVLYLWVLPTLFLIDALLRKYGEHTLLVFICIIVWGLMLYIPGMIWFVGFSFFLERRFVIKSWQQIEHWQQRATLIVIGLLYLPLLFVHLARAGNLHYWLGLPNRFDTIQSVGKHFLAVPVHIFIRGPENPQIWLARAPVLDIFTLAISVIGIYFYITHWRAQRSKLLLISTFIGFILVGLNGAVQLSLLIPLVYIAAAAGLTYLLREWFKVFPSNPLARGLGLSLISIAVCLSCIYNLRSYFVAWPHNQITHAVFRYHI
ncbi:MAG TPA: hypothetical protein VLF79_04240 [Candidatus Saccharimonadales bacterium]|nr:hypothetical protein [Candidatus Saccharimonadales bacterium]